MYERAFRVAGVVCAVSIFGFQSPVLVATTATRVVTMDDPGMTSLDQCRDLWVAFFKCFLSGGDCTPPDCLVTTVEGDGASLGVPHR